MDHIRGIACISILKFLKEKKGDKAVDEVLAILDPDERETIKNAKSKDWLSLDAVIKVWSAILDLMSGDKEENTRVLARYIAVDNTKWFLKLFLKFSTPEKIVTKIPTLWKIYFDKGEVIIEKVEKGLSISKTINYNPRQYMCLSAMEWARYAFEMCGAKNIRMNKTKCIMKGDDFCRVESRWE